MDELIDILDEHGEKTGRVASRTEVHNKGYWHRIAVVAVIDEKNRVLLQQRSKDKVTNPGKWDISAAGHIEAGEDALTSAVRETAEEVGIEAAAEDFQYIMTYQKESHPIYHDAKMINKHIHDCFILKVPTEFATNLKLQANEVSAVKFCTLDEFRRMLAGETSEVMVDRQPFYEAVLKFMGHAI